MRITSPASARPDYRDRNPIKRSHAVGVNPGAATRANTQDWSRTIPAGKKGQIELLLTHAGNRTGTALNGLASATVTYTPSGGSGANILMSQIYAGQFSVSRENQLGSVGLMLAGDNISGYTRSDNSAAGSDVVLETTAQITEFDA